MSKQALKLKTAPRDFNREIAFANFIFSFRAPQFLQFTSDYHVRQNPRSSQLPCPDGG